VSRSVQKDYETIRERQAREQEPGPVVCPICEVDHRTAMADLSHGIIRLLLHAQERMPWMGFPISGDNVARQRAGITGPSILFSTHWDENDPDDE
jgi:hypothetical protein